MLGMDFGDVWESKERPSCRQYLIRTHSVSGNVSLPHLQKETLRRTVRLNAHPIPFGALWTDRQARRSPLIETKTIRWLKIGHIGG